MSYNKKDLYVEQKKSVHPCIGVNFDFLYLENILKNKQWVPIYLYASLYLCWTRRIKVVVYYVEYVLKTLIPTSDEWIHCSILIFSVNILTSDHSPK